MTNSATPIEGDSPRANVGPTRERILDQAEVLFASRGFSGTSVRDIASNTGLTPASLYNHFPGKDALYRAVLERGVQPLIERLGALAQSEKSPLVAKPIIEEVMAHLAAHSHLPRLVAIEAATGGENLTEMASAWIKPLIERGRLIYDNEIEIGRSPWEPHEVPLALAAWLHLVFGHFAMAPLLQEVLGRDPLSPECLADQSRFLLKLSRLMGGENVAQGHDESRSDS
jgi:AcrR family transcriptional regulator